MEKDGPDVGSLDVEGTLDTVGSEDGSDEMVGSVEGSLEMEGEDETLGSILILGRKEG